MLKLNGTWLGYRDYWRWGTQNRYETIKYADKSYINLSRKEWKPTKKEGVEIRENWKRKLKKKIIKIYHKVFKWRILEDYNDIGDGE